MGSTLNTLGKRWQHHKDSIKAVSVNENRVGCTMSASKRPLDGLEETHLSPYLREYGANQFKIMAIKEYEVVDRKHLHVYETLWINKLHCINKKVSFNPIPEKIRRKIYYECNREKYTETKKRWYENNRGLVLEQAKIYHENNKEARAVVNKIWRESNRQYIYEKNKEYVEKNKKAVVERTKIYYENNREMFAEKAKTYRENNKEAITKQRKEKRMVNKEAFALKDKRYYEAVKHKLSEKIQCECGSQLALSGKTRHLKSAKHQEWLKTQK